MPRRRRKLSPELEKKIADAKRRVELISAIINDIHDDDIQAEYRSAFSKVQYSYTYLASLYDSEGLSPSSEDALEKYILNLKGFEDEYEV